MSTRLLHNARTRSEKRTKTLVPVRLSFENLEDRTLLTTIYGITPGNVLIRFDSATPALITSLGTVSDVGAGETIRGIDYRPRTGQLFASTVATGSAANSVIRTYVVNPDTAQATIVGATAAGLAGAGDFPSGYDFNPTVDRIRYVNADDENARLNPNNGSLAGNDTDLTPAATTAIIAGAYDRNFDRQAISVPANNVIPTTLYVINRVTSTLAVQGGVDGAPSPNGGVVTDLGALGFTLNAANDGGFDIAPGAGLGRAFAALTNAGDGLTRLYAIDLDTGVVATPRATAIGLIGNGTFEIRSIAAAVPNNIEVVGSDAGVAASVKVIDAATGFLIGSFGVFGADFLGGVRVAAGDVNGDGITDVIVGAGSGTQPRILVVDGTKLNYVLAGEQIDASALLASFLAYDSTSAKGVFVAAGDVNGDGRADIVAGPGGGALPVKVYDGAKLGQLGGLLSSFLAYQPTFKEGVTVAADDVNGDGRADVITGMAKGGSRVNIVDATKLDQIGGSGQILGSALLGSFLAFAPSYRNGVFVGAGDVSGDGRFDILIGAGADSPPTVKVVDANRLSELTADGRIADSALLQNFLAFDASYTGGVRVGAVDVNLDGLDDLIVGTGAKNRSRIRVLDGATLAELDGFLPFAEALLSSQEVFNDSAFVTALYQDVLKRPPDASGLANYTNLLANGTPLDTIAADFWESAEHRGIQVDSYYHTYLKRSADSPGRQFWIDNMLAGMTEETVVTEFLGSSEYQQLNPGTQGFVDALYRDVLGRPADASGESSWMTVLTNHTATPLQVIQSFVNSHERHLNVVDSFYKDFLGRPADAAGETYWVQLIDQGLVDDEFVAVAFLVSQEFLSD